MDILVIGGGIMGLSAAWACRREGYQVTVVERGPIPNPRGSSVDQHRLIRYPYGALAGYGALIPAAYRAWDALWSDLGERFYAETGTLVLAYREGDWAHLSRAQLEAQGIPHRVLDAARLSREFPQVLSDGVSFALHTPSGGVLFAERIVAALAAHLSRAGARVLPNREAVEVDFARARVRLANGEELHGDAVIVAAGAWVARLVPTLAPRVTPSRQVVAYVTPPADFAPVWERSPMLLDIDEATGFYAVPPVAGTGLKLADHRFSLRGDPDREREPTPAEARAVLEHCRHRLRDPDAYRLTSARTCFYTVTADERFLALRNGKGIVMSPCSGHGFKFGPLLGRAVADTLAGRRSASDLARFAAGNA